MYQKYNSFSFFSSVFLLLKHPAPPAILLQCGMFCFTKSQREKEGTRELLSYCALAGKFARKAAKARLS
jgi:hypothetical protein